MAQPSLLIPPQRFSTGKLFAYSPLQSTPVEFSVTRGTTAFRTNVSGTLESMASGIARLDYRYAGALQSCPALLVEPAATNLLLRSEEFNNAYWTKIGVAITANDAVAPNGTTTAELFTFTGTGYSTSPASVLSSGTTYTLSVYVRAKNTSGVVRLAQNTSVDSIVTSQTYNVDTNWQRITFTFTAGATSSKITVAQRFSGDTEFYYWGAQLETGSVATSYIPTVAATATRNADLISLSGASGYIGQTQGSIFGTFDARINAGHLITLSDGTSNNSIQIDYGNAGASILRATIFESGVPHTIVSSSALVSGLTDYAFDYNEATQTYRLWVNGINVATAEDTGNVPTMTQINFGSNVGGSSYFNGHIGAHAIYKEIPTSYPW